MTHNKSLTPFVVGIIIVEFKLWKLKILRDVHIDKKQDAGLYGEVKGKG